MRLLSVLTVCLLSGLSSSTSPQPAPSVYYVQFNTTVPGSFIVQVNTAWAPIGAQHLYDLVNDGFYDNAAFFRVVQDFIVQFGIAGQSSAATDLPS